MTNFTRKQYIAKECSHQEYYGQEAFATPSVLSLVADVIGVDKIKQSTDPHFNDIPLRRWDGLHGTISILVGKAIAEANGTGGISLSDTVCVAKAAAQIIRGPRNEESDDD